jgi:hypothetical protein
MSSHYSVTNAERVTDETALKRLIVAERCRSSLVSLPCRHLSHPYPDADNRTENGGLISFLLGPYGA